MRPLLSLFLSVAVLGSGAAHAVALDTTHTTAHRTRSQHLVQAHHARHHAIHRTAASSAHRSPNTAAAHAAKPASARTRTTSRRTTARAANGSATIRRASLHRRHRYYERFTASSFATPDEFAADITAGEDPVVRQAAIDALGDMNGTAVVIDPSNGRILAMVNQKLALSPGAEPCSTIKLTVAMAALSEGLVTRDTMVRLPGFRMNMTQALAKSNNLYFEELGRELGFERVKHYANEFGLGELAGWHIEGEQLGEYPDQPILESDGGVGKMCSFGQGVSMTPLQLGAYVAALANGGTLYYLQHPATPEEVAAFQPRIKRTLDIARYLPDIEDGMAGAVDYGTARRLRATFSEFPVFGKTGTCSNDGTRFGWFASFSEWPQGSLVTVFFLEGGRPTFGPRAAELTGDFYRNLWEQNYFTGKPVQATATASPAQGVSVPTAAATGVNQ
ncbi:MAG: penicillin-binding transpeptidase domain-containing protein [Terracidiphilus sp.]